MANTKVPVELSSTPGIVDNSNATAITIDSSENVGIGTSSPSRQLTVFHATNATHDIKTSDANLLFNQAGHNSFLGNSSTSGYLQLFTNNGNSVVNMLANGDVGIGTSPNAKLHIATADGTTFSASNSSWHTQVIKNDTGAASNASGLCFFTSANGYHVNAGSGIACVKNGTNSDYGADLVFITRPQSAVAVERMRIDSNGNVGIGSPPVTTLRNDIHATEKGLQVGRAAMLFSDTGLTTDLQNNSHLNNSDQRVAMTGTLGGTLYGQYNGQHTWYTAAAVAAPNVQSMTARMSLDISGNLVVGGNVTAFGSPSDIRLKENIEVIPDALDKVKQLRGVTFNYKKDGNKSTGLIAQDLEKVLPDAVYVTSDVDDGEDKHLAVRYGNTVGLLVEAIKELEARVKELESK